MPTKKLQQQTGNQRFDWPLIGKVRTDVDPMLIGETNYRSLVNMRYTADGIQGIQGMTPINVSALSYSNIVNGFHFRKDTSSESHIFLQASESGSSTLFKSDNIAAVPHQDTFSNFEILENTNTTFFSNAPDGAMAALNGTTNRIWTGEEGRCSQFIVYDPAGSFWYDYTDKVNNNLSDVANVALMPGTGGGLDTNAVTMLHLDNNVTDSSASAHTVTNTDATFSNTDYIFGGYSAVFNGSSAKLSIPDHADFDFTGGNWAVDGRFKVTSIAAVNPIYYQSDGSGNYISIYIDTSGYVHLKIHQSTDKVDLSTTNAISINTWYYISVEEKNNDYYIFIGPTAGTATLAAHTSSANRALNYTSDVTIGYDGASYFLGKIDEFRVSKVNRHTVTHSVPLSAYSAASTTTHVYIGSARPIQGVKFYVGTANGNTATATAYEWTGAAWTAISPLTDGTAIDGKTLAITGSISFASTVSTSKLKCIKRGVAYFYQFVFTGVDNATTVYHCTLNAPMQPVTDLWDGAGRTTLSCFGYNGSAYTDFTTKVAPYTSTNQKVYVDTDTASYADFTGMLSSGYVYCGYSERLIGLEINLPDSNYVNSSANTTILVDYWNGSSWVTVGYVDDSTSTSAISLSHSGIVTWNAATENTEFQTNVSNDSEFYYYRIHFSVTLGNVRVDTIEGITASKSIRPYRFSVFWQNRLWMFNDQSDLRNAGICSAYGQNCVFNGDDSIEREFGDDKELVCGDSIFSRYGSNLYDNMVLFKRNACFLVDGISPGTWTVYTISDKIGIVAPLTLKRCDMSYEVAAGQTKHVLVGRSERGIEFLDGNTLASISDDIQNFFDPTKPEYIDPTVYDVSQESAGYDEVNYEYHWFFTNVDGNQEWVYNLKRRKWTQFDRGTGKALNCGIILNEASGSTFLCGGTSDGFLERLEYGTTFDGNSISYTMWLGDLLLPKTGMYETKLKHLKLFAKAKNISSATVAITHYADGALAGTSLTPFFQKDATHRIYQIKHSLNINAVLHSLKYVVTTSNETVGFEPYMISGLYEATREDTYGALGG